MAWPLTPIVTFVPNATRWTASFANQLQAGVNGIVGATYSLGAAVIDGTGGATVTPELGTVKVSKAGSGTSHPRQHSRRRLSTRRARRTRSRACSVRLLGAHVHVGHERRLRRAQLDWLVSRHVQHERRDASQMVPSVVLDDGVVGGLTVKPGALAVDHVDITTGTPGSGLVDLTGSFYLVVWGA